MSDDPYGPGWWVGSDGNWHSPDEDFDADVPVRNHPVRRVAVVVLAVAVVGATTLGVWLGAGGQSAGPGGPSVSALDAQVEQVVTGTGAHDFGVTGVTGVACGPAILWRPGATFECSVYASPQRKIGVYDGTVEPTTSSGDWRWIGTWYPIQRPSTTE